MQDFVEKISGSSYGRSIELRIKDQDIFVQKIKNSSNKRAGYNPIEDQYIFLQEIFS